MENTVTLLVTTLYFVFSQPNPGKIRETYSSVSDNRVDVNKNPPHAHAPLSHMESVSLASPHPPRPYALRPHGLTDTYK